MQRSLANELITLLCDPCPCLYSLLTNAALCHNKLGQPDKAIEEACKAMYLNPSLLRAYERLIQAAEKVSE
jgi:hypothetical protein